MFGFLKRFGKKTKITEFSTTLTTAEEGTTSRKDLSPDVASLVKSIKKQESINNEDLNTLAAYYFNSQNIAPGVYNIQQAVAASMCFEISGVNPLYDAKGDVVNIYVTLREITFNNEMVITVSVKDFHETFNHLTLQHPLQKS